VVVAAPLTALLPKHYGDSAIGVKEELEETWANGRPMS
jgi:hypothetical protein